MRLARVRGEGGGAFYHCMSRVVEGRFIFNTMDPAADGALEAVFEHLSRTLPAPADYVPLQIAAGGMFSNRRLARLTARR